MSTQVDNRFLEDPDFQSGRIPWLENNASMLAFIFRAAAALCLCFALTLPAHATPAGDARTAITAAYAGLDKATASRSVSSYSAYLAPDFAGFDSKGAKISGKDKILQALKQTFAQVSTAKSVTRIMAFSLQDGGAVVTTHTRLTLSGTKQGKLFVLKSEEQDRDFWVIPGGRWLLKRERGLSVTSTLDGHPVPAAP